MTALKTLESKAFISWADTTQEFKTRHTHTQIYTNKHLNNAEEVVPLIKKYIMSSKNTETIQICLHCTPFKYHKRLQGDLFSINPHLKVSSVLLSDFTLNVLLVALR